MQRGGTVKRSGSLAIEDVKINVGCAIDLGELLDNREVACSFSGRVTKYADAQERGYTRNNSNM